MLGKTNTPTFGWIGATHNLLFGITRNPWNLERTPGGSSGGASAAAAAGLGPLHVGTDGGGSIRIPASCAGIFGFKPSYGRIPTHPASGAWSLSHIGPMTRTVADAALMLHVCAGPDERDQYSLPADGRGLREVAARRREGAARRVHGRPRLRRGGRSRGARVCARRRARSASSAATSTRSSRAGPRRARPGARSSAAASRRAWRRTSTGRATSIPGSCASSRRRSRIRRRTTCRRGSTGSPGGSIRARSSRSTICC